jgi:hypothetical protein
VKLWSPDTRKGIELRQQKVVGEFSYTEAIFVSFDLEGWDVEFELTFGWTG